MYTGLYPPPNALHIRAANFTSKELTFSWSPVAPDCPAIHYNILASNCGSCPTTTNHTNVTCTDVPTNDSIICTFVAQTIRGNTTGNVSDSIRVNTDILFCTEYPSTHKSVTNTVYIVSISFLATALVFSVAVIIRRNQAKTKDALGQSNGTEGALPMESMYDIIADSSQAISAINTQENVAYGHMQT